MGVAGFLHLGVEMGGILGIFDAGVEVRATAEPPGVGRPEHAGVHVDRRAMRVDHMGDEADSAGPEARVLVHAGNAARGHRLLRAFAKGAVHFGDVHPDLFEHTAAAHHAHQPAAAIGTGGGGYLEPAGGAGAVAVFEVFERGDDPVAQAAEPCGGFGFAGVERVTHRCLLKFTDECLANGTSRANMAFGIMRRRF